MDAEEANRLLVREYSRLAENYDAHAVPRNAGLVSRVLDAAAVGPGDRILDLGCGPGNLAFAAVSRVGERGFVDGIDLAEGMIRVGVAKAARKGPRNVRFAVADGRHLPYRDATFDVVASCLGVPSVGHLRCFGEAHRVLRRSGRLAFCVATGRGTAIGTVFREMLEEARPANPSPEIEALLEARRVIQETGELASLRRPENTAAKLREIGFVDVRLQTDVLTQFFPTAEEYVTHQLSWGDNEREWRAMRSESREVFLRKFAERTRSSMGPEGLPYVREMLFYVAAKEAS